MNSVEKDLPQDQPPEQEPAELKTHPREILGKSNQDIKNLKESLSGKQRHALLGYELGDIAEDKLDEKTKEIREKIRAIEEAAKETIKENSKQSPGVPEATKSLLESESADSFIDYYKVLGVEVSSPKKEIKEAYDQKVTPIEEMQAKGEITDIEAAKMLQPLSDAYQVLRSDKKRKNYDAKYQEYLEANKVKPEVEKPTEVGGQTEVAKPATAKEEGEGKKEKLKRPEGASLSEKLNEIKDNPEALEHLKTQLAGEKVYHFKKGEKQYLTVNDIREEDGKWVATLIAYDPDGAIDKITEKYSVDKIKFKHWKKELPKEVEETAFIRDSNGYYGEEPGSIKGEALVNTEDGAETQFLLKNAKGVLIDVLFPDQVIKYEYEGGVAYAERTKDGRPKAPEGVEVPEVKTSALTIGKGGIEMEGESIESSNKAKADLKERAEWERLSRQLQEDNFEIPELGTFKADNFEIPKLKDDESLSEAGIDQGGPVNEKPRVGFWRRLFGFGKSKLEEGEDLLEEEIVPKYVEGLSEKEIKLLKTIEKIEGKKIDCPKCLYRFVFHSSANQCPSCERVMFRGIEELKNRKKQIEKNKNHE